MNRLEHKVAIITGGMKGIGFAAAEVFVEQGAKVLLVDMEERVLQQAVRKLGATQADYAVADVTDSAAVAGCVQKAVDRFGKIDILFCNAGIGGEMNKIWEYSEASFDQVMGVNVKGVWLSMKAAIPEMIRTGGGSILITSSVAGLLGSPKTFAYSASKHAVVGLMKSAAAELARYNIRVNTIHPGPIETDMVRGLEMIVSDDPGMGRAFLERRIPFRRYGTAREVGELALFLASDESKYITGSTHRIDGGFMSY
jgi:NAD(P)-dependent dehydrogenase (short-subunit alcohol dehydrogenase family)